MTIQLSKNELVELEGMRVHFTHRTEAGEYCFRDFQNGNTRQLDATKVLTLYADGKLALRQEIHETAKPWQSEHLRADFLCLDERIRNEAKRRMAYLDGIEKRASDGPRALVWPPILEEVRQELGDREAPSWQTVSRWRRDYLRTGRDIRALVPGHKAKGRSRIIWTSDQAEILRELTELWLSQEEPSKEWFVEQAQRLWRKASGVIPGADQWAVPSRSTLLRILRRLDRYEVIRRRQGKRIADEQFKAVGRGERATYRLQVVEIDHTELDIYVVDEESGLFLGRPWITVAIDRYTRMIVGLYIGFEPPSTHSVMQCLRNMILPKTYMKTEFPGLAVEWKAYGIPVAVVVDNAKEFISQAFRDIAEALGFDIWMSPVRHPEFKGMVERFNRTVMQRGLTASPGKPIKPRQKKSDYVPQKGPCLSLKDFRAYFHYWLLTDYCYREHSEILDVPARRWEEEMANNPVALPAKVEQLDALLGITKTGQITREGIQFMYLKYQSGELNRILRDPTLSNVVTFRFNPGDMGCIHVIHPRTKEPFRVPVRETERAYATGLTIVQHKAIIRLARQRNRDYLQQADLVAARDAFMKMSLALLKRGQVKRPARLARQLNIGVTQPSTDIVSLLDESLDDGELLEAIRDESPSNTIGPDPLTGTEPRAAEPASPEADRTESVADNDVGWSAPAADAPATDSAGSRTAPEQQDPLGCTAPDADEDELGEALPIRRNVPHDKGPLDEGESDE